MGNNIGSSEAAPDFRHQWWTPRLAAPVLAAAAVRATLAAILAAQNGTNVFFHADTYTYLIPGRNLLFHGQFMADGVPDLLRAPGYPLFLALTSLAGFPAAIALNAILSLLTIILTWKLARMVFAHEGIALGAAWIFAFEPIALTSSLLLTSETLFLLLFLLSMERLAEFFHSLRLREIAFSGLWLAAATFVRPVTYYLPVFLALGVFVVLARPKSFPPLRQTPAAATSLRWKAPALLLLCILPWLAAWDLRNWVETGYSGFTCISDENLYYMASPNLTARLQGRPANELIQGRGYGDFTGNSGQSYLFPFYLQQHPEQVAWSQTQRLAFMHAISVPVIKAHPAVYLTLCMKDLMTTVFNPVVYYFDRALHPKLPARAAGGRQSTAQGLLAKAKADPFLAFETALSEIVLLAVYFFAARGLYDAAKGRFQGTLQSACLWLLLGVSLYFLAVSVAEVMGPLATARYRLPVMPVVCILAAAGFLRARKVAS